MLVWELIFHVLSSGDPLLKKATIGGVARLCGWLSPGLDWKVESEISMEGEALIAKSASSLNDETEAYLQLWT
ncbi:hypothetical protein KY290_013709 [Solanum tuberosum]|uniref:Uncharacterized protein n=1 Tax=Solanum tuberosum TaxID=4113 RepID=A0ABQ7VMK6_SOLTU|nr:hypothetical protein KY289_013823 [Solanum tuberosum]KAH0769728.1 hypothetical protein KY290_013709 [Solanum tuberosum]